MLLAALMLLSLATAGLADGDSKELTVWAMNSAIIPDMETNTLNIGAEAATGIHINWQLVPEDEAVTKLSLSLASNEYPDIWAYKLTPEQIIMGAEAGAFLPLNDLIEESAPNYAAILASNPTYKSAMTAPDGNIYTAIHVSCAVHVISPYKMFVYQKWLDELNLEMPATTEEFKEMLIAFRDNDMNGNGDANDEVPLVSSLNGWNGNPLFFLMNPFQLYSPNLYLIDDNGKPYFIANTDGWKAGLEYMRDLYSEGLLAIETYVQDANQLKAMVNKAEESERIVGAVSAAYQGVFVDSSVMKWLDYLPVAPLEGPTGLRQSYATSSVRPSSAISTQCKDPGLALSWLDFWLSEEGTLANLYGMVEGVDYEMVDIPAFNGSEKSLKPLGDRLSPTSNYLFGDNIVPIFDTVATRYITSDDPDNRNIDNTYILVSAAEVYEPYYVYDKAPLVNWSSDNDWLLMKAEINDYAMSCSTKFIVGEMDLEADWDEYLSTLDSMGLAEYIEKAEEILK